MANFRRKRRRRNPKCGLCTPHRGSGNSASKNSTTERVKRQAARRGADQ